MCKANILEEEESRLKDEITLLRDLKHENILSLYRVYDEPKSYFLVTEVMGGGDLLSRLNEVSFFPEVEGRRITRMILDALHYMHENKVAHRDIKPENVLLASHKQNTSVKLADFGFAKMEVIPDSFTTMCGSPAYVAPEVLRRIPYGPKVDIWSAGIVAFAMLAGYQPFRSDDEKELQAAIVRGEFVFEEDFWKFVSQESKRFISSLLVTDPKARTSAEDALADPWFSTKLEAPPREDDTKVFFMIGSQRSGSNWLRTMLEQREDLAGPHPPHIMRDFMPILDKFGDLSEIENFRVLVDHACTFVERNQVPWTDRHGSNIKFPRPDVCSVALKSCMRVKSARLSSGNTEALEKGMYLLSIFDAIMAFMTKANGKHTWMCKSMGMSKFHDLLLEYYGPKRLRYIYLVRDPRDVAMSFMKT